MNDLNSVAPVGFEPTRPSGPRILKAVLGMVNGGDLRPKSEIAPGGDRPVAAAKYAKGRLGTIPMRPWSSHDPDFRPYFHGAYADPADRSWEKDEDGPWFLGLKWTLLSGKSFEIKTIADTWLFVGDTKNEASDEEIENFSDARAGFFEWCFGRPYKVARDEPRKSYAHVPTRAGVYFIQQGAADGPIKIGKTGNARQRFAGLQSSSALPLRLLVLLPGGLRQESELHARFAAHRMLGEWFAPAAEILAFVEGAAS